MYEEICRYFDGLKIPLDTEDISDVIKRDKGIYKNMMTGKTSAYLHEVVRKPFVCGTDNMRGFYVFTDEHFLGVVIAGFDEGCARWVEEGRFFVSKEFKPHLCGRTDVDSAMFDICGQAAIIDDVPGPWERGCMPFNYSVHAAERIRSYFGDVVMSYKDGAYEPLFPAAYHLVGLVKAFLTEGTAAYFGSTYLNVQKKRFHRMKLGDNGILTVMPGGCADFKIYPLDMPHGALDKIGEYKELFLCLAVTTNMELTPFRFSIIQDVDGKPVQRCFRMGLNCSYPYRESSVSVTEYMRILCDGEGCMEENAEIIWTDGADAVGKDPYVEKCVELCDRYILNGRYGFFSRLDYMRHEYAAQCHINTASAFDQAAKRSWALCCSKDSGSKTYIPVNKLRMLNTFGNI